MRHARSMLVVGAWLALSACGPSGPADPGGTGGTGGGGGGQGGGGQGGGGGGASTVTFDFDRQGARNDKLRTLDVAIVGVGLFFDQPGPAQKEGAACEEGDAFFAVKTSVRLDLQSTGRTPIGTVQTAEERDVAEVRLFLSAATVVQNDHPHAVHGVTCIAPDGKTLVVLAFRPDREVRLQHAVNLTIVLRFDPRRDLDEEQVVCREDHGGGGGGGGGDGGMGGGGGGGGGDGGMGGGGGGSGGGMGGLAAPSFAAHGEDDPPECEEPDDDDDHDPTTRHRFALPPSMTFGAG